MKASAGSSTAISPPASSASSAAPPKRFRLLGPSAQLDPRITAYRRDIADIRLADRLFAPHYARAERCACVAAGAMLRSSPNSAAPSVSQLLLGEGFEMLDRAGGWAWGRCVHDDYVGHLPIDALGEPSTPTHRIVAVQAPVFGAPDIKSSPVASWTIGGCFAGSEHGDFVRTAAGYVHRRHAAPLDEQGKDYVTLAERLIGMPYLWGGRGAGGIDCSGLVQLALGFAGIAAPRDSDQQRAALGRDIEGNELRRGDLIFFPGHVGLMVDDEAMIHANAYWMAVMVEPLADVVARLRPSHAEPILARRRIAP